MDLEVGQVALRREGCDHGKLARANVESLTAEHIAQCVFQNGVTERRHIATQRIEHSNT